MPFPLSQHQANDVATGQRRYFCNFSNDPYVLVPKQQQIQELKNRKEKVKERRTKKEQPVSTSQPKCRQEMVVALSKHTTPLTFA